MNETPGFTVWSFCLLILVTKRCYTNAHFSPQWSEHFINNFIYLLDSGNFRLGGYKKPLKALWFCVLAQGEQIFMGLYYDVVMTIALLAEHIQYITLWLSY